MHAIRGNLVRDIMLGNFELPDKVPPLTLLIKDPDENQVPTPISSNRNEDQVMMLTPVHNRKMQFVSTPFSAGKREEKPNSPRFVYYKTKVISPDKNLSISEEEGEETYVYRDIDDEQYSYKFSDDDKIGISNDGKSDEDDQEVTPKPAAKHRLNTTGMLQRADMLVSSHDMTDCSDPNILDYDGLLLFVTNIFALCDILKSTTSINHMASSFNTLQDIVDLYKKSNAEIKNKILCKIL